MAKKRSFKVGSVILCAGLLTSAMFFSSWSFKTANAEGVTPSVEVNTIDENLTQVVIEGLGGYKNSRSRTINYSAEVSELIEQYDLDLDLLNTSSSVIIQEERVSGVIGDIIDIPEEGSGDAKSDSWSDDEGYLTICTIAYQTGKSPTGHTTYKIVGQVNFHKTFKLRNKDILVLRGSDHAVFDDSYTDSGVYGYHASIHNSNDFASTDIEENRMFDLTPNYSYGTSGVAFEFRFPEDNVGTATGGGVTVTMNEMYTNWWVIGYYGISVLDTAVVQVSYIHNENLLGGDLSLSFGPVGLSFSLSGSNTVYDARPMTLYDV